MDMASTASPGRRASRSWAECTCSNADQDLCVLLVDKPTTVEPIPLRTDRLKFGESLWAYGFGGNGQLMRFQGTLSHKELSNGKIPRDRRDANQAGGLGRTGPRLRRPGRWHPLGIRLARHRDVAQLPDRAIPACADLHWQQVFPGAAHAASRVDRLNSRTLALRWCRCNRERSPVRSRGRWSNVSQRTASARRKFAALTAEMQDLRDELDKRDTSSILADRPGLSSPRSGRHLRAQASRNSTRSI